MHVFSCLPGDGPVTGGLISVERGAYKQQFIVSSQAGSNHAISREVVCTCCKRELISWPTDKCRLLEYL